MTDSAHVPLEGETPVNPYSLLEAVNRSSDTAHMAWLVFLGIMTYLTIAVAGVTHRDLLLETPVSLPILQVDIQLTQFFQFAPIVLVLFHLGLVSQLALLARKTLEFDQSIQLLETTSRRTHPLRLELHNFFFVQAIGGPSRSMVIAAILHTMSWLTLVILPVVVILYIQVVFLPYHNGWITWTHRIALLFDVAILVLIGVFLMRAETSFFQAFARTGRANPVSFMMTTILLAAVTFFSFFVATVPGETLDRIARSVIGKAQQGTDEGNPEYYSGFVVPYFTAGADGTLFGIFRRNLVVTDTDLVADRDVQKGEPTLTLRGRDLRYAKLDRSDMHQADFTGANLDHASLNGTDLRDARLQCADYYALVFNDDRKLADCVSAQGADFSHARLMSANLSGIDVRFAKFEEADLDGALIPNAILIGANFSNARLRYVNLTGGVQGAGVNFLIADLRGANLFGAKLYGADFRSAGLTGATLDHAHLDGAKLTGAALEGATLVKARLRGADLSSAMVSGADFRDATVWLTKPPKRDERTLVDYGGLILAQPTQSEIETLESTIKEQGATAEGIAEQLSEDENLSALIANTDDGWLNSDDGRQWQSAQDQNEFAAPVPTPAANTGSTVNAGDPVGAAGDPPPAGGRYTATPSSSYSSSSFSSRLTAYLAKLMCRAQWSDGSVARGTIRRAMQKKFRGDLDEIERSLQSASCPASHTMPKDVMLELSEATDRLRDR